MKQQLPTSLLAGWVLSISDCRQEPAYLDALYSFVPGLFYSAQSIQGSSTLQHVPELPSIF